MCNSINVHYVRIPTLIDVKLHYTIFGALLRRAFNKFNECFELSSN